jgi:hypothetical protein
MADRISGPDVPVPARRLRPDRRGTGRRAPTPGPSDGRRALGGHGGTEQHRNEDAPIGRRSCHGQWLILRAVETKVPAVSGV